VDRRQGPQLAAHGPRGLGGCQGSFIAVNTDVDAPPHVQDGLEQWPDVTIIIPAYNAAHDLARCLHNIRAQEYPHERLHVFVIDDDSTDDTRQVAVDHDATVLRNGYKTSNVARALALHMPNRN
jgi:cellulose synthase/poly-beta-1,6-N-acetylglucosamine synthase-like glycosyltransferase